MILYNSLAIKKILEIKKQSNQEVITMTKTVLTIGLFDKDTESQKIGTESAKNIIANILLNVYDIFAFTMIECNGYYKMQSTGNIVNEPSIRVEIASDSMIESLHDMVSDIKTELNQESVMVEITESDIQFI